MMARMQPRPFTADTTDDLELACEIERDAEQVGAHATLARYLPAITDPVTMPLATDAAIEAALRASCANNGASAHEAARALALLHPTLEEVIHAVALGFGLPEADGGSMEVGRVVLGRWRVVEFLGSGATAQVARAQDALLSADDAAVEVVIKRFADSAGGDARLHALREMRALAAAPMGLVPRIVALHAPRGCAACIVTMHEPSREMRIPEDLATAVDAVRRLHRVGITHGDIKPAHIRIREDGSVMLIDFGTATPATVESRERDLRRLLEMAVLGARSPRAQWLLRTARACRGSAASAAALRLASPWWRRRAALRGCVAAVLLAVLVAGLAAGWQAWRASTRQADAFAALAATGRLVDATVDSSGRLIGLRLDVPEMAALYSDSPGRTILISRIRFDSDGGLTIFDVDGHPMSR